VDLCHHGADGDREHPGTGQGHGVLAGGQRHHLAEQGVEARRDLGEQVIEVGSQVAGGVGGECPDRARVEDGGRVRRGDRQAAPGGGHQVRDLGPDRVAG
jgi:hypothetical protein